MNYRFFSKFKLTQRIIVMTIMIGLSVFLGTDIFIEKEVEHTFRKELEEKLQQQSIEGRAKLDHFIKSHYQLSKIITSQQSYQEHLKNLSLPVVNQSEVILKRTPSWLPKKSILRSVAQAYYYLLIDKDGKTLELYNSGVVSPPAELRTPSPNLIQASHNENFISSIEEIPYIISSESVSVFGHKYTLLLATPIDDALLMRLLPSYSTDQIVVLSTGFDPYVVTSSNAEAVPKGVKISSLRSDYLIAGEQVYNYELTDLLITYSHLVPISKIQELSKPIVQKQRLQHTMIGLALIFSFTFVMLWMTKRIEGLTQKVVNFSKVTLKLESPGQTSADEISILENEFRFLTEEVIASTRNQASLLDSVLRAIPNPIFYKDVDGKYLGCNDAFTKMIHYPKEKILGKTVFDILPTDQASVFHDADQKALQTDSPISEHTVLTTYDDTTYDIFIHRAVFERGDGSIGGLVGAITDVSEITKVRDELMSAHALLKSLIDSIPDLIFYKDPNSIYLGCNKAFMEFVNKPEEQIIGHTDHDLFPEDLSKFFREKDQKMLASSKAKRNDEWVEYPDGRRVMLDTLKTPIYGSDGSVKGLIGISRDITEQYIANEKIKAEYTRFQNVLDSFNALVYVADMETYELLFINKFGRSLFGDISGKKCWQALQQEQNGPCPFCTNSKLLNSEGKPTGVCIWEFQNTISKDWFECQDQAIPWPDGRYVRLEIATKINERKRAEELQSQLLQAQKIESIGTLAGGIAHDFNNILTPIIGYTELALSSVSPSDSLADFLKEIQNAADRAKNLINQILIFSRKGEQIRQPLYPHIVIKETLKLLRSSLPTTITIEDYIPSDCGMIMGDPTQLQQIIMNLCTNAYHAMRDKGGILSVSLKQVDVSDAHEEVLASRMQAGRYIEIEVSDTGCGMDKKTVEKIFEPYFTTKIKGEGTGLGLATVHGIVNSYNGHITVYSEPGHGTTFKVYLPHERDIERDEAKGVERGPLPAGNERLLIVDDEKTITNMLAMTLTGLGYHVTVFNESKESLKVFEKDPDAFDLILTDMTMPELTGLDLSRSILAIRPNIPIILCTGYSELINKEKAKAQGIREFLMKPLTSSDLAYSIRRVLEQ